MVKKLQAIAVILEVSLKNSTKYNNDYHSGKKAFVVAKSTKIE